MSCPYHNDEDDDLVGKFQCRLQIDCPDVDLLLGNLVLLSKNGFQLGITDAFILMKAGYEA